MVEGRPGADAHEFGDADIDRVDAVIIGEMRDDAVGHGAESLGSVSLAADNSGLRRDWVGSGRQPEPGRPCSISLPTASISPSRDEGEGSPILLIHGFGSNTAVNWGATGWINRLTRAGRRVIALDNRGHGESEKLYDPAPTIPR